MISFLSTFISGLGDFIAEQLKKDLDSVEINLLLDGLVVYKCNSPAEVVKQLRYLNNSFQSIKQYDNLGEARPVEMMVEGFIGKQCPISVGVGKSFRVMFYNANSPVAVDKRLHEEVEKKILNAAQPSPRLRPAGRMTGKKLIINRANPDFEYWFLYRKEGYGFLGLRLTKHPDYKDVLEKGQLRPELTSIMILLSNPQPNDVILDPFVGNGAIPLGLVNFSFRKFLGGDINLDATTRLKSDFDTSSYRSRIIKNADRMGFIIMDALSMQGVADNSIDKIITDPPWGIFQKELDTSEFYLKLLSEAVRVLVPGGTMVLLVGRDIKIENILVHFGDKLDIQKKYDILVSGKKATIYFIVKNNK